MRSPETVEHLSTTILQSLDGLTLLKAADIATGQSDPNFVDFGGGNGTRSVVVLLVLSDVTHLEVF